LAELIARVIAAIDITGELLRSLIAAKVLEVQKLLLNAFQPAQQYVVRPALPESAPELRSLLQQVMNPWGARDRLAIGDCAHHAVHLDCKAPQRRRQHRTIDRSDHRVCVSARRLLTTRVFRPPGMAPAAGSAQLRAADRNLWRCFDANPHLVAPDHQHPKADILSDQDFFVLF
jgi:hypothetical protein